MSEHTLSNRILAGALTFIALGLIWVAIVSSLPSEQELAAKEAPIVPRALSNSRCAGNSACPSAAHDRRRREAVRLQAA
jgi:hypothetical protein